MKKILTVEGMSCSHCEKAVKDALGELSEVANVNVNLKEKIVEVEGDGLEDKKLKDTIDEAGYEVVNIV